MYKAELGHSVVKRTAQGNMEETAELSHNCQEEEEEEEEGGQRPAIFCCLNTGRFVIISAVSQSPTRLQVGSISVKVSDN